MDLDIEDAPEVRMVREMRGDVEGPSEDQAQVAMRRWQSATTASAPYVTGPIWDSQDAADAKRIAQHRSERIEHLPDGRVRIDVSLAGLDMGSLARACNAEGLPIRFWSCGGGTGEWHTEQAAKIDPASGYVIGEYEDDSDVAYPESRITAEHVAGPDSELSSLTFDSAPTEPVQVVIATTW
ncbi:hypothetical protein [Janibacter melonis]|uniref:hypothetical protein n=1 Tax=Janibacter melonis TaxID=262209 RepID=UPI0017819C8A|nr:hypothetical protein [Janibacter melonis]